MATTTTTGSESEQTKKPAKEVPIVQDQGTFVHATGDMYEGYFEAKKKDRSVKMHGAGIYKSTQGDTYTGIWEYDKLGANAPVTITHADGSKYEGSFKEWQYLGGGRFTYPDESILECNFVESCPVGGLSLTDPNGHVWLGNAVLGCAWLEPSNHFYGHLFGRDADVVKERRHRSKQALT